jgi:putative lipoic acid-binding regulatory protein
MTTPTESIIAFPCDFTLKIMGKNADHFEKKIIAIVLQHFPKWDTTKIQQKPSKDGNYLSLSVTVHAESKAELDALYQTLSSTKEILMVL